MTAAGQGAGSGETGGASFETFDPERHDRTALSTGVVQVDNFFRKTANKLARADNVRVTVLVSPKRELIGFHAINVHAIDYRELPSRFARSRPAHGNIPAAFISMIGVDQRYQRQGYGGDLLFDCMVRIVRAADVVGIAIIVLDVLDCGDSEQVQRRKSLYQGYGFMPLASDPLRLFLPVASARELVNPV
ncbi:MULTISPECIES: GNAT family N-acetyltransferase [Novosphingobium]|uniref:GNAT family N-acetyltransferase n=2 Tax=Novosphingobium TaxID=165696 RepID=A0ABQ2JYE8_9SPHN|nr:MULTISPECIES: GNAT family N-acetyltransferase [Novosphingobium]MCT2401798.1 GNAT family N-acetyltransferase [Novosphingobium mangrovi (ex Huang et al. 2023)]GGN57381.1 hypothetical protein GCM10011349_35920 [Novosphingobium indicum]